MDMNSAKTGSLTEAPSADADVAFRYLEASVAATMAAARAPGGYGGGGDHGGRSWRRSSDRRRIVGIPCSVLLLIELGGLLVQVYLLLTNTSFVENPPYCIAYN